MPINYNMPLTKIIDKVSEIHISFCRQYAKGYIIPFGFGKPIEKRLRRK